MWLWATEVKNSELIFPFFIFQPTTLDDSAYQLMLTFRKYSNKGKLSQIVNVQCFT